MIKRQIVMVALLVVSSIGGTSALAGGRVIEGTYPAQGIDTLKLNIAVGDATITAGSPGIVVFHVRLTPHRGGLFTSMSEARQQVAAAKLDMKANGATLKLAITAPGKNTRFEAAWTISVPPGLGVSVRTGVGDVTIRGINGPVTVKDGVGDVMAATQGSHVVVDVGVGDVTIRADRGQFGHITASAGVGDASLTAPGQTVSGTGMVGKHLTWTGPGHGTMRLKTGVGDVEITLEARKSS